MSPRSRVTELVIETIVESVTPEAEVAPAVAETVVDLQAKYGFDEQPAEKTKQA